MSESRVLAFRLVRHDWPELHGDLFIENGPALIAYRWPGSDLPDSLPAAQNAGALLFESTDGISLTRGKDHRLLYWTHSGPVEGGRGEIAEIARGKIQLSSPDFPAVLRIKF